MDDAAACELQCDAALAAAAFKVPVILRMAHTDPDVAWAHRTEAQAKARGVRLRGRLWVSGLAAGLGGVTLASDCQPPLRSRCA